VLYELLTAATVALIAITVVVTAREYGNLPDRVGLHFGFDGTPGTFGPRSAIWIVVGIQVFIFAVATIADRAAPHGRGEPSTAGTAAFLLCILGFTAQLQFLMIAAAKAPGQRLAMRQFWTGLVVLITAAFVSLHVL